MSKRRSKARSKSKAKANQNKGMPQPLWIGLALALLVVGVIVVPPLFADNAGDSLSETVSVEQAYALYQDGIRFLDVRTVAEWEQVHIEGATLIPLDQLKARKGELSRDVSLVVYCRSGNRSAVGRDILLEAGFENVTSMAGGINQWEEAGYPVVQGAP